MSYQNKYYPDYEKLYPGVSITPEVLAVLRTSDRQMRKFEEELKSERFAYDRQRQRAEWTASREDSLERLMEEEGRQFAETQSGVEAMVIWDEAVRHLRCALARLSAAEREAICAYYYRQLSERACAAEAGIKQSSFHARRKRAEKRLRMLLSQNFSEIFEKGLSKSVLNAK